MHKKLAFLLLALAPTFAQAKPLFSFSAEPIVGYERVQKLLPTPHTKDRLVYGGRVLAGFLFLQLEAEYTRGTDTESFDNGAITTLDVADKAKLGLRASLKISKLRLYTRSGVQATRNRHEQTEASVTTVTDEPITYDPYAGAGLRFQIGKRFAVTADVTAVFKQFPDMAQNEYITSAGFSVSLP